MNYNEMIYRLVGIDTIKEIKKAFAHNNKIYPTSWKKFNFDYNSLKKELEEIIKKHTKEEKEKLAKQELNRLRNSHFDGNEFTINSQKLLKLFNKIKFAMCKDSNRPTLQGIWVDFDNYEMVATDSHRLAIEKFNLDNNINWHPVLKERLKRGFLIPYNLVKKYTKNVKKLNVDVKMLFNENTVRLEFKNCILEEKKFDVSYPNHKRVLPKNLENTITFNRSDLLEKLKTLLNHSHSIKLKDPSVIVAKKDNQINLDLFDYLNSKIFYTSVITPQKYDKKNIEIRFNLKYLIDALAVSQDNTIDIKYSNGHMAVEFITNDSYSMLMPMKF